MDRKSHQKHAEFLCRSLFYGIPRILLICAATCLTSACITTASIQEATGETARLHIRLLRLDTGLPVVGFEETPQHNETILAVEQVVEGCDGYSIFVNPSPLSPNRLTFEPLEIDPIFLDREADEHELWRSVSGEQCALVLMIGAVEDTGFVGLSLSTREGPVKRVGMYFQDDKPGKGAFWFYSLIGGPVADAVLVVVGGPVFGAMAIDSAIDEPFSDPVTVSFDFPDGNRRQVSLSYEYADDVLRRNFPHLFSPVYKEWEDIRFWTRAALLKLRLDAREVVSNRGGKVTLGQVGQYEGNWRFDPRDGRGLQENISVPLQDTRYIRYKCSSCTAVPLVGVVREPTPVPPPVAMEDKMQRLRKEAENGYPLSQWRLYEEGGKRRDDWPWLCKAADQEYSKALLEIGDILWSGRDGVDPDRELAYCWYRSAVSAGNKTAEGDVLAAEWMLPEKEIESAMQRCEEIELSGCDEILFPDGALEY